MNKKYQTPKGTFCWSWATVGLQLTPPMHFPWIPTFPSRRVCGQSVTFPTQLHPQMRQFLRMDCRPSVVGPPRMPVARPTRSVTSIITRPILGGGRQHGLRSIWIKALCCNLHWSYSYCGLKSNEGLYLHHIHFRLLVPPKLGSCVISWL